MRKPLNAKKNAMTLIVICASTHGGKWSRQTTVAPSALTPGKAGHHILPSFIRGKNCIGFRRVDYGTSPTAIVKVCKKWKAARRSAYARCGGSHTPGSYAE